MRFMLEVDRGVRDPGFNRLLKRLAIMNNATPARAIDLVGRYLLTFSDRIDAGDEAFFLDLPAPADADLAEMVANLKAYWHTLDAGKKGASVRRVQGLLDLYVHHLKEGAGPARP